MKRTIVAAALVAVAGLSTAASADTVTGGWNGTSSGVNTSITFFDSPGSYNLGASGGMNHTFTSNSGPATAMYVGNMSMFCTDGNWAQNTNNSTYTLNDITSAPIYSSGNLGRPTGGSSYTTGEAQRLNAIASAGYALGLIDNRGSFNSSFNSLTKLGVAASSARVATAFQLLVWESLWENWDETSGANAATWNLTSGEFTGHASNGSDDSVVQAVATAILNGFGTYLGASTYLNGPMITKILTVNSTPGYGQDMMVLTVPLPPAAYAGLGSLAGALGISMVRRRKLQAL